MLTQLCAVALIVHVRIGEENPTFASVAVISQHKHRRSVSLTNLVADKNQNYSGTSRHVADVFKITGERLQWCGIATGLEVLWTDEIVDQNVKTSCLANWEFCLEAT